MCRLPLYGEQVKPATSAQHSSAKRPFVHKVNRKGIRHLVLRATLPVEAIWAL